MFIKPDLVPPWAFSPRAKTELLILQTFRRKSWTRRTPSRRSSHRKLHKHWEAGPEWSVRPSQLSWTPSALRGVKKKDGNKCVRKNSCCQAHLWKAGPKRKSLFIKFSQICYQRTFLQRGLCRIPQESLTPNSKKTTDWKINQPINPSDPQSTSKIKAFH